MRMPSWLSAVPQERSHTAEAKLLETTAQLEELQVRQRQLEARNLLLEKVARLNKQTVLREAHEPVPLPWEVSPLIRLTTSFCQFAMLLPPALQCLRMHPVAQAKPCPEDDICLACDPQGDAMWQAKLSEGGKTLVLTVWSDKTQLLTVEQASQLTLPEFGRLWKVHLQLLFCVS